MLSGKVALVTGAGRGIGRAIALTLAGYGADVAVNYSGSKEAAEKTADEIRALGRRAIAVRADISKEAECTELFHRVQQELGVIDILVNNAGVPYGNLMQMTPLKNLREVMEINFIAQIHVMQLISRVMMRQKSGSIINMGSVGGIEAREGYLAYGSSKAALLWATRSVSKELAKYNIRVNAVAPGLVESDMGMYKKTEEQEKILNEISMKRMGRPEEIAEAVYFLATDASSFMTGAIMNVDGGRLR